MLRESATGLTVASCLVLALYGKDVHASWQIDNAGVNARDSSMAIDSADRIHIAYADTLDSSLKYTTNATGHWMTETIDVGNSLEPSIAVDSSNDVHISYVLDAVLKHATNAGGMWTTEIVDNLNLVGTSAIAVDSGGYVHISYYYPLTGQVNYTNNLGGWSVTPIETLQAFTTTETSIALDSNNGVHLSYVNRGFFAGSTLHYANNVGGPWSTQVLETIGSNNRSTDHSLAIDSNDDVHISYSQHDALANLDSQWYATNSFGGWVLDPVDAGAESNGRTNSLAIDASDHVRIVYTSYGTIDRLVYATNEGGSWATEPVETGMEAVSSATIGVDSSGNAHVVYDHGFPGSSDPNLKHAANGVVAPKPDVKVNGQDGLVFLTTGTAANITVSLDPGGMPGAAMDFWIGDATAHMGTWWIGPNISWVKSATPVSVGQFGLFSFSDYSLYNAQLGLGYYSLFFILDANPNGVLDDISWIDTVNVVVTNE